jgi:uncharacterized repeat protein (TIGR03803 family)
MPRKRLLIASFVAALALLLGLLTTVPPVLAASKEKVLHDFDRTSGQQPHGVTFDAAGNLYGTTSEGGANLGVVFQLTPGANGTWIEKVLHSFQGPDGSEPQAELALDAAGNLYGTTYYGGASGSGCGSYGCGTVFRLAPHPNGQWSETVLYSFDGDDGLNPVSGVVYDVAGNLYGTTPYGGIPGGCAGSGCGLIFQLVPHNNGTWTENVLHRFGKGKDGSVPWGGLIFDATGNLYGTTTYGGAYGYGTVFELAPATDGKWIEKVLHSFNNKDGSDPGFSLTLDSMGDLYGVTMFGGDLRCDVRAGCGTVFELIPGADGKWTEKVLHAFHRNWAASSSGVIFDAAGNLYGTTTYGGRFDRGILFKLSPGANGKWTATTLRSFFGERGIFPDGRLTIDGAGNLYGTTSEGGMRDGCCGLVFEFTP